MKSQIYMVVACLAVCNKAEANVYDLGDRSDWIDPSDMLNYDSSTQRMKKTVVNLHVEQFQL